MLQLQTNKLKKEKKIIKGVVRIIESCTLYCNTNSILLERLWAVKIKVFFYNLKKMFQMILKPFFFLSVFMYFISNNLKNLSFFYSFLIILSIAYFYFYFFISEKFILSEEKFTGVNREKINFGSIFVKETQFTGTSFEITSQAEKARLRKEKIDKLALKKAEAFIEEYENSYLSYDAPTLEKIVTNVNSQILEETIKEVNASEIDETKPDSQKNNVSLVLESSFISNTQINYENLERQKSYENKVKKVEDLANVMFQVYVANYKDLSWLETQSQPKHLLLFQNDLIKLALGILKGIEGSKWNKELEMKAQVILKKKFNIHFENLLKDTKLMSIVDEQKNFVGTVLDLLAVLEAFDMLKTNNTVPDKIIE